MEGKDGLTTWIFKLNVDNEKIVTIKVYSERKAMKMKEMIEQLTGEKMKYERWDQYGRVFEN